MHLGDETKLRKERIKSYVKKSCSSPCTSKYDLNCHAIWHKISHFSMAVWQRSKWTKRKKLWKLLVTYLAQRLHLRLSSLIIVRCCQAIFSSYFFLYLSYLHTAVPKIRCIGSHNLAFIGLFEVNLNVFVTASFDLVRLFMFHILKRNINISFFFFTKFAAALI